MELARIIDRDAPLGIQVTKQAGRKFIEQGEHAAIAVVADIGGRVLNTADASEGNQIVHRASRRRIPGALDRALTLTQTAICDPCLAADSPLLGLALVKTELSVGLS